MFIVAKILRKFLNWRRRRYQEAAYLRFLAEVKEFLTFLDRLDDYLSWKQRDELLQDLTEARSFFAGKSRYYRREVLVLRFNEIIGDFGVWVKKYNAAFVVKEKQALSEYFDDIEGKALDGQQRSAVITDEYSNLIVAGAGSGKTLTILGKVKYLIEKKRVDPNKILLLSFTRKTVEELNERLESLGLEAKATTFHSLGYSYVREFLKRAPTVTRGNLLAETIETFIGRDILEDKQALESFVIFASCYMVLPEGEERFESLGEKIDKAQGLNYESLRSRYDDRACEQIDSADKLLIANFLFLQGVNYEYRRPYSYEGRLYRPDFYLPEYNIWLEHFEIDEMGRARWLSAFNEQKYLREARQKKAIHKKYRTNLLETYSYYNRTGILLPKLSAMLEAAGVLLRPFDLSGLYKKIMAKDSNFAAEMGKLASSFINLAKSGRMTESELRTLFQENAKTANSFMRERQELFLNFILPIMKKYDAKLKLRNELDFNDMINLATDLVSSKGLLQKYDYIIVDEYQDISVARFELIRQIREKSGAKLICVGDDWQSIYRFAGSDISLFSDFGKSVGEYSELLIEQTYRNSQELIDVSAEFVQKNPLQIRKKPRSQKQLLRPIVYRRYKKSTELEVLLATIYEIVKKYGEDSSILILARHAFDLKPILEQDKDRRIKSIDEATGVVKIEGLEKVDIKYITVHKSKGLEADNVIILNLRNDLYGFPNKLTSDPILSLLLGVKEDFSFAEERRLFYVALTRTKNQAYLLLPRQESLFVKEIVKYAGYAAGDNFGEKVFCPWCKTGELLIRKNRESGAEFLGCSHYPRCKQSFRDLDILTNPLLCPACQSGFLVKRAGPGGDFLGCTNYPRCRQRMEQD